MEAAGAGRVEAEAAPGPAGDLVLRMKGDAALEEIVLRKIDLGGRPAIYVHALDPEGAAAASGLRAGVVLKEMSWSPFTDEVRTRDQTEEIVPVVGTERLDFIKSNWEITEDIVVVFEGGPPRVTEEMVRAAGAPPPPAEAAPRPVLVAEERPDLYSDKWEGDVYVGGQLNILTVILGLLAVCVLVGVGYGIWAYGDGGGAGDYSGLVY